MSVAKAEQLLNSAPVVTAVDSEMEGIVLLLRHPELNALKHGLYTVEIMTLLPYLCLYYVICLVLMGQLQY